MAALKTKTLIKNAFWAIFMPHKAFTGIKETDRVEYKGLIWWMFVIGLISSITHHYFLFQRNLLTAPEGPFGVRAIQESVFRLALWILGSLYFYFLDRLFRKDVSIRKIEIGVYYLWFIFIIMPVFDLVHFFGFNFWAFSSYGSRQIVVHFSWLPGIAMFVYESFFLFLKLLGFKGWELVFAFLASVLVPFLGRFSEETPQLLIWLFDLPINIWPANYLALFLGFVLGGIVFWKFHSSEETNHS